MILEKEGLVSFKEVEAVMEYIDVKLTQKVSRQDLAKRLGSEAQLQFCFRSAMKEKKKHEQPEEIKKQSIFQQITG